MDIEAKSVTDARPSRTKTVIVWLDANVLDAAITYIGLQVGRVAASPFLGFILARFGATTFWTPKACLTIALPAGQFEGHFETTAAREKSGPRGFAARAKPGQREGKARA